jgi:mono/diheme cytochrome c family protein
MRKSVILALSTLAALATSAVVGAYALDPDKDAAAAPFERLSEAAEHWKLLQGNCIACHNTALKSGGIAFDAMKPETVGENAEVWEKAIRKLRGRMMPPPGNPRPDEARTEALIGWLEAYLDHAASQHPDPGRVALHRLNRKEYANAVRDLLALDIDPAALLPQDDVSDGFDNVADVLQVSPSFLDQYISAARSVSIQAVGEAAPRPSSASYSAAPDQDGKQTGHVEGLPLGTRGGVVATHYFPADGEYEINIADMALGIYFLGMEFEHRLLVVLDGKTVYSTMIGGEEDMKAIDQKQSPAVDAINGRLKKIRFKATAGPHKIGVTFLARTFAESEARLQPLSPGGGVDRLPHVNFFEVRGPFNPTGLAETPSRSRIFICRPAAKAEEAPCADKIFSAIAHRAYRGPVSGSEMKELRRFFEAGQQRAGFEEGVRSALTRILASPGFLYRAERDPAGVEPGAVYEISDLDLASRLSFFLWSSIPDDELLALAEAKRLREPGVLEAQVKRMLADKRAGTLASNFAFQWLQIAKLNDVIPDANLFPAVAKHRDTVGFDGDVRADFKEELRLFIGGVFHEDRSVLELLTAHDTYLNERLALHYGVKDVKGDRFRRVELADSARWGLLGKGAILMGTSYPNRTAPVLRGAWILENIVGTPPAPPPPGVEALKENIEGQAARTVRERMVAHRVNPSCNACHGVMDPLGLALENFDAVGAWRTKDRFAGTAIDASGELPDGRKINGPNDLRAALLKRPDQFVQTFTEKLMTFALGRTIEYHDMPTVRSIVRDAAKDNYRFSSIVLNIVESDLFRKRTASEAKAAATGP